ncbi:hypothetical protein Pan241w_02290 [Gimesia alba]|uniref:Uncharacterized protein n=1 Tax=Gimesia alba TaxID=2527973 RepID=A0A517R8R6_9PLAN|nr:hypothetical protein Pan241w_02290 [Gimesia alba]
MFCFCQIICWFAARCVRPGFVLGFVSGLTRGWNENTKSVMQIICKGVRWSRGKEILMWCERWLAVCRKRRRVYLTVSEMRRCVSTRITFGGFHLKNCSETSGFLQVRLKPVSQFHLNQQCSRARRATRVIAGSTGRSSAICVRKISKSLVCGPFFRDPFLASLRHRV